MILIYLIGHCTPKVRHKKDMVVDTEVSVKKRGASYERSKNGF